MDPCRFDQLFGENELLAAVAAIPTRFSKDEEYANTIQAIETVNPGQDQTLEEWL